MNYQAEYSPESVSHPGFLGEISNAKYLNTFQNQDQRILTGANRRLASTPEIQSLNSDQVQELGSLMSIVEGLSSSIEGIEDFQHSMFKTGALFMYCEKYVGSDFFTTYLQTYKENNDFARQNGDPNLFKGGDFLENIVFSACDTKKMDKWAVYQNMHQVDEMAQLLVVAYEINSLANQGRSLKDAATEVYQNCYGWFDEDELSGGEPFVGLVLKNYMSRLEKMSAQDVPQICDVDGTLVTVQ